MRTKNQRGFRDNHFRLQSEFIFRNCRIFNLEDGLEAPIVWLQRQLGVSLKLPASILNASPPTHVEPNERAFSLISEFYAEDFETFNYEPFRIGLPVY